MSLEYPWQTYWWYNNVAVSFTLLVSIWALNMFCRWHPPSSTSMCTQTIASLLFNDAFHAGKTHLFPHQFCTAESVTSLTLLSNIWNKGPSPWGYRWWDFKSQLSASVSMVHTRTQAGGRTPIRTHKHKYKSFSTYYQQIELQEILSISMFHFNDNL